jgi:GT2 family glycosyltransferase
VTDDLTYEVIAVDNGSRDGSADMLASWPDLLLLSNERNLGFASAANQAYASSHGEMVLLLNSDICLQPGALTVLARFLREQPEAAGVAPLFLSNHQGLFHYQRLITFRSALAQTTALRLLPGFRGALRARQMRGEDFSQPRPVPMPAAACLLLRRSVLSPDKIFDERLPLYFNDVLLAKQLAAVGHHLWMTPESVVTHVGGASTRQLGPVMNHRHGLGGLVRYLRITQSRRRLRMFQGLVLLDWAARRLLFRRGHGQLDFRDIRAALSGDVGPLPDRPTPTADQGMRSVDRVIKC